MGFPVLCNDGGRRRFLALRARVLACVLLLAMAPHYAMLIDLVGTHARSLAQSSSDTIIQTHWVQCSLLLACNGFRENSTDRPSPKTIVLLRLVSNSNSR